ncbi:MAG: lactate racemase domain-containing protein [Kofleriaceae bacterium]
MVVLPYGRVPYPLDLGNRLVTSVLAPASPPASDPAALVEAALDHPIGRPRLEARMSPNARVTVIVSDATRNEPRAVFLEALRRRLPGVRWTLAIATGTHGPSGVTGLGIPSELLAAATVVDHDGHSEADLVSLGVTSRGTPMRVHRCVVDADLVIATGCIRPHYFAGFGAGVKAIFPGLGGAREVRINHRLKTSPLSRAGRVDDNPCRLDLEEAVGLLSTPTFLLDGVCAMDGRVHAAVAGDPIAAFRRGVEVARPWFTVRASRAPVVIASDVLPVTATLYQSAKIAAACASLVEPDGALIVVAECAEGTGPLATVNEAILRIGVLPRLAPGARLFLVSSMSEAVVSSTLATFASSVTDVVTRYPGAITVVPTASQLLFEDV